MQAATETPSSSFTLVDLTANAECLHICEDALIYVGKLKAGGEGSSRPTNLGLPNTGQNAGVDTPTVPASSAGPPYWGGASGTSRVRVSQARRSDQLGVSAPSRFFNCANRDVLQILISTDGRTMDGANVYLGGSAQGGQARQVAGSMSDNLVQALSRSSTP